MCKILLFITPIIILNFIGINYAAWTASIQTVTSFSMAKMQTIFCSKVENYNVKLVQGTGLPDITFSDSNTVMTISGTVYLQNNKNIDDNANSKQYNIFLDYSVLNKGTVPIRFDGDNGIIKGKLNWNDNNFNEIKLNLKRNTDNQEVDYESENLSNNPNLKLIVNQPKKIIYPEDTFKGISNPNLHIEVYEAGTYIFEINLPYVQWNYIVGNSGYWKEDLIIKGNISVIDAPLSHNKLEDPIHNNKLDEPALN